MTRILFVCTGNICRSPMAEALMRHKLDLLQVGADYEIDSAGTGSWHVGENADPRTLAILSQLGIRHPSRARQVRVSDFDDFDHIFAMDESHQRDLLRFAGDQAHKVSLFLSHDPLAELREVPDPYYGSALDYRDMYAIVDQGVDALIAHFVGSSHKSSPR